MVANRAKHVVLLAILGIVLSGCLLPTPTAGESRIFRAVIQPSDLPQGWRREHMGVEKVPGAESRALTIKGPPGTQEYAVLVTQQIIVYTSAEAATDAYPELTAEWFPTSAWVPPEELDYESTTADQFRFECMLVTISGIPAHGCRAVGRYGDMVSLFMANVFKDQWFTWKDMEHVLKVIDLRMDAERE